MALANKELATELETEMFSSDTNDIADSAVTTAKIANNNVTAAKLDPQVLHSVDVTVSTAEILALNATPKTVLAAPGVGLFIRPVSALLMLDYNSAAYAGIAGGEDLTFKYTNSGGTTLMTVETTGFLDQTADATRYVEPAVASTDITPVANAPVVLHLLSGEITTGNSPLKIRFFYKVLPTVL